MLKNLHLQLVALFLCALMVAPFVHAAPASAPAATQGDSDQGNATDSVAKRGTKAEQFMKMHESFLSRIKSGKPIDILFMGDSITQGWNSRAKDLFEKTYGPGAVNFGIGGDRTQHVIWRIENGELDGINPKVMVLMIGTNNTGRDSAEE